MNPARAGLSAVTHASASRRQMLKGAAATGVSLATAGVVADILFASPANAATRESAPSTSSDGSDVIAHVRNVRSGEIDVYVGTRHVTLRDKSLAARLARAAR